MNIWQIRSTGNCWEIYSINDPEFTYATCQQQGQAIVIAGLMNGTIRIGT